jgi:hypothetical protein
MTYTFANIRLAADQLTRALAVRFVFLLAVCGKVTIAGAADFTLTEHLGHTWNNERVTFPLTLTQAEQARKKLALIGPDGRAIAYQLVTSPSPEGARICFQADLPPLETRDYSFSNRLAAAKSDLQIRELPDRLVFENEFIGLAIRKTLKDGQGPIAAIRLLSGGWTGDSTFVPTQGAAIASYGVDVLARGPVFCEAECRVTFADNGEWRLRFRVESGEPVILVEEFHDAPAGGIYSLVLGGKAFRPTHMLNRDSRVETAVVRADPIGNYLLEPWLHWNNPRHGNWIALFTPTPAGSGGGKGPTDDMLVVGVIRPSLWVDPKWSGRAKQAEPNLKTAVRGGLMTLDMPVQGGRRAWLLGALDKTASSTILTGKNRRVAPPPQQLIIKHGDFPLDKVKDFVLEWKGDEHNHPLLHIRKKDLPELRKRLKPKPAELRRWVSEQPINKYLLEGPIREFFASGDPRLGKRMAKKAEEYLQTCVDWYLKQDYLHCPGTAPHMQSLIVSVLNLIDPVLSTEAFTPEARRRVMAKLAFLGYVIGSPDYWSPERGYSGFANMTSVVALYRTGLGCMLPSHPRAKAWAEEGLGQLHEQLYAWSDEDGGWLEAPHYAMVSLDHMIAGFSMAANAGYDDYAFDPRLRKVYEWFATISTPRDSRTGGFRHLPPIGNTYHGEPSGIWGVAASVWKDRDSDFAERMLWMFEQGGSFGNLGIGWNFPSMLGYRWMMSQTGITPKPADFGSRRFRKTGVVLRNSMQTNRETYLHLIAGSNHDHYDADSGSIILYGKGRILCDDWGYIGRHPDRWHSMLTSSDASGSANMEIDTFAPGATLDYVSGRKGAWQRQIAFSKDADPLGPNFFLIRDTHNSDLPATWRLWLTAIPRPETAAELLGSKKKNTHAQPGIVQHDQGITLVGGEDVDLDIFLYESKKLALKTETATQRVSAGYRDGRESPLKNTQTALIATLPGRGTVAALLCPRLKHEPPPTVTWHADGQIAKIVSRAGTDYVFLTQRERGSFDGKSLRPLGRIVMENDLVIRKPEETDFPSVTMNQGRVTVESADVKYPPKVIGLHPGPKHPATVVWRSPATGSVVVNLLLQDGNSGGGDGIHYDLRSGSETLFSGQLANGGKEVAHTTSAIEVTKGSLLRLVIWPGEGNSAKGQGAHWWDSTFTEMTVRAVDGSIWNLRDAIIDNKLGTDPATDPEHTCWWLCEGDAEQFAPEAVGAARPEFAAEAGELSFRGHAGAIQIRQNHVTLTLSTAGEIGYGNEKLTEPGQKKLPK